MAPSLPVRGFSTHLIEAALEDELYPLAETQIWDALSIRRTAEETADLTLLLLRALIGQKQFDTAIILADESAHLLQQDAFAYWRARASFEAHDFEATSQALKRDEKLLKSGTYAPAALRMKGHAEQKTGHLNSAEKTLERCRKNFPNHEDAAQNLLDLARIQLELDRKNEAARTLHELLERFSNDVLSDSVRLLLARELIADGGKRNVKEAAILLQRLAENKAAHPRLRIAAWVELSALEQRADHAGIAANALLEAETLTDEAALRARQKTARAYLLIDQGQNEEALILFDEAMQTAPDETLAATILLQKAEALLEMEQVSSAEKTFQAYLDVTTDPDGEARAWFGKGWTLWEQEQTEEAAMAFENSAAPCTDPDRCAIAWVKAGDARLAAGQAGMAANNYRRVLEEHATHPLAARSSYQYGIALLATGQTEEARLSFANTEFTFPQSDFAPRAALQYAAGFQREKKWELALQEYQRTVEQYTHASTQVTALHQQGLILFGLDQWAEALEKFRAVRETDSESPEAPQAFYMQGICRYRQGDVEAALDICRLFIEKYPGSLWTTEVLFWLGEHAYNQGDYPQAQTTFLDIVESFPQHELADDALLWAGNSLLKQDHFLEAFALYSRLAKNHPNSVLLLQTRFAQGEVLTELGEFSRAILAYEEVIKMEPDHPLADRARGRLGDCLFTLGTSEMTRYQEALNVYQALYKRSTTPFAFKLQALYKIARSEDKMGQTDRAFAHDMETVYEAGSHSEPLSPGAVLWFTRAAFEAAAYQERQTLWKEAVHIYKRIIQAGVPARDEASNRIKKIKQEHAEAFIGVNDVTVD